ncbi:hypothetical protein BDR04DRAFT_1109151 [Suillus decipiens]|nr:hypothetical protein BDR04DRAFT_1109151 [Suillus decipiens]
MIQDFCASDQLGARPSTSCISVSKVCSSPAWITNYYVSRPRPRGAVLRAYSLHDYPPNHNSLRWFIDNLNMMMEDHLFNVEYINRKHLKEKSRTDSSPIYCVPLSPLFSSVFQVGCRAMSCALEKPVDFPSTRVLTGPMFLSVRPSVGRVHWY